MLVDRSRRSARMMHCTCALCALSTNTGGYPASEACYCAGLRAETLSAQRAQGWRAFLRRNKFDAPSRAHGRSLARDMPETVLMIADGYYSISPRGSLSSLAIRRLPHSFPIVPCCNVVFGLHSKSRHRHCNFPSLAAAIQILGRLHRTLPRA